MLSPSLYPPSSLSLSLSLSLSVGCPVPDLITNLTHNHAFWQNQIEPSSDTSSSSEGEEGDEFEVRLIAVLSHQELLLKLFLSLLSLQDSG